MRNAIVLIVTVFALCQQFGCASMYRHDIAHYSYPEAQAELRAVLKRIVDDSATANVKGLADAHLRTDKFTKFGGRLYDRLNLEQCIEDETASRLSVQNYKNEPRDVQIDVFDDVAVMTYYNNVRAEKEGKLLRYTSRQTLVFLKTIDGWKIVHEHQSQKKYLSSPTVRVDDQFFDSAGVRIRYVDLGPRDGEPIVLVAGFSQTIERAWGTTGVIDALDDDHRVIALDLRGHGKSDKPHEPGAYGNEMVADIVRLFDHLEIEEAHVVGYSMGGRIVAKLVVDHPERVKTAMPSGTNMEPPDEEGRSFVERMAKSLEESGSIRPALEHFNADGSMTEEQIEQIVAMVRDTNDTKALAAVIRSIDEFLPERSKLEANTVPCLCIIGEDDPNLQSMRVTAEYMANLEIEVVRGANHLTTFQDPAFILAIKSFVLKHAMDSE